MRKYLLSILILLTSPTAYADTQDLDEVLARKARYTTNTHYSGESGPYYYWQPETLMWRDTTTDHEVWRVVCIPGGGDIISKEYSTRGFSGDGSRLGFFDYGNVRASGDPSADSPSGGRERWVVNADGSGLRAGTGRGYDINDEGFLWMNTERASYLMNPDKAVDFTGALTDAIYKVSLDSNNSMSRSLVIDINDGRDKYIGWGKDCLSSNDSVLWTKDISLLDWPTPNDINSQKFWFINITEGTVITSWGSARGYGPDADPYGNHVQADEGDLKGGSSYLVGPNGLNIITQDGGESILFWLTRTGTAADGGPEWYDWDGDSFGTGEILPMFDDPSNEYEPHNPYGNGYPGHMAIDRWGHYASVGCGQEPADAVDWGGGTSGGGPGRVIIDFTNNGNTPPWQDASNGAYIGHDSYNYAGHASWTAWSDYTVFMYAPFPQTGEETKLQGNYYNRSAVAEDNNYRAADDLFYVNGPATHNPYHAYTRPSQSPDGTKVAFASVLFHSDYDGDTDDDDHQSLAYVVAYYPHPPEITSCTQSGGTVTVTFEWMLDTTPRGYTSRGWPDESTNNPPPPRETKKFRLWRSADKATWTPLGTVDAEIFTRYDFATGVWSGNDYWTITDTPGAGTWYYAVTSVEWSGLESHCLGNIYAITIGSGNGAQDTAYPASPGDLDNIATSDFHTSFVTESKSIIRHYNIYAEDGSAPTVSQTNRIATIPVSACSDGSCSWVDWLGATDGSTQYVVTAVDTQGNESNGTFITTQSYSALETDGQYSITWDDMYEAYDDGGLVSGSSTTVSGTVNWH